MKIAIIGTGMVGRTLAARLEGLGHDVVIGTRDVEATLARTDLDAMGTPPIAAWLADHPSIRLAPLSEAGDHGEIVVNATAGIHSLAALELVGPDRLADKILLDVALPLDLSNGLPPTLVVSSTDSLGEQVQRAAPRAKVVKALTSVFCEVMVDPSRIPGRHSIFVAGDDADAKAVVTDLIVSFGWPEGDVLDLGGIDGSRAVEMYSRLYFQLVGQLGTFDLNIQVVRA